MTSFKKLLSALHDTSAIQNAQHDTLQSVKTNASETRALTKTLATKLDAVKAALLTMAPKTTLQNAPTLTQTPTLGGSSSGESQQ